MITIDVDNSKISDGYHTIAELYDHRCLLFLNLCKLFYEFSWKSKKHNDGTSYEDWFLVGIQHPEVGQLTYHIPMKYWNVSNSIREIEIGIAWDGHTSTDVLDRLEKLLSI